VYFNFVVIILSRRNDTENHYEIEKHMSEGLKVFDSLPKSFEQTFADLGESQGDFVTNRKECFCFVGDNDMVVLTTVTNLCTLATCDYVLADGTFDYSPKHFAQLYGVHGYKDGYYMRLVFAALRNKEKAT